MANSKPISISSSQAQSTIPDELRNDIYSALLSGNGIRNIEGTLNHELAASGFKDRLKAYITHLLRSGECTTFDEANKRALDKVRHDTQAAKSNGTTNGVNGVNGHSKDDDEYNLCMPREAIIKGTKTVRAELEEICDITVDHK